MDCVNTRVVLATSMTTEPFMSFAFDGVLGLGLAGLSLAPEFNFFGQLALRGQIALPQFGVFLANVDAEESEISFGGSSPEHYSGDLHWTPVAMPELGHWQVRIVAIRVGDKQLDICAGAEAGCRAVVDTGTSLLAVPSPDMSLLQNTLLQDLVQDTQNIERDGCKGLAGPPLHFELENNFTITLQAEDYTRPAALSRNQSSNQSTVVAAAPNEEPKVRCWPTLMPLSLPEPLGPKLYIWGEPVLRKYYTLFDWESKQIGFGTAVHLSDLAEEVEEQLHKVADVQQQPGPSYAHSAEGPKPDSITV
jgi:cathepsin D